MGLIIRKAVRSALDRSKVAAGSVVAAVCILLIAVNILGFMLFPRLAAPIAIVLSNVITLILTFLAFKPLNNWLQEIGGKASCSYADDHWRASLHAGYSQLMNRLDDMDLWDLGFSVSYRFKHWEIWLQGSNLFNLNETEWMEVSMNPVYTSTTIYRKIPGSLLIGLAYRFSEAKEEPATMIIYN